MKLFEITNSKRKGTYAGAQFDDKSVEAIMKYIDKCNIPNPVSAEDLHVTILYSRKYLPEYRAKGAYHKPIRAIPRKVKIWSSSTGGKNILVMPLDSSGLTKRHKKLMDEHEATYDYATYKPHVTLSYDVGSFDIDDLPTFDIELELCKEYSTDLRV